ncbi:hypothetical protein HDU76_001288, partial [Blyttiomyces sp. JEL0837]
MAAAARIPPALVDMIRQYALKPQTAVSLKQMVEFGRAPSQATMLRATQFIHNELPIRLAHRVAELENLPHNLSTMPSVLRVKHWYTQSFKDLVEFPKPEDSGVPQSVLAEKLIVAEDSKNKKDGMVRYFNPVKDESLPKTVQEYNKKFVDCIENIKKRHDPVATTL